MKNTRRLVALLMAVVMTLLLVGCAKSGDTQSGGETTPSGGASGTPAQEVDTSSLEFPLAETAELSGLTNFPYRQ